MTASDYQKFSLQQLVQRFEAIALSQDQAVQTFQTAKYNRLYEDMELVRAELKSRAGDQRRALAPLLKSRNEQVRLKAAISLLRQMPEPARHVLDELRRDKLSPQCIDAGTILQGLDDGSFVPE